MSRLAPVDIGPGCEELFRNQLPALLTELAHRVGIQHHRVIGARGGGGS